jgi:hypothetical protein
MATAHQKLAQSLAVLKSIQDQGIRIIKASEHKPLTRIHRERLLTAGFIKPAMAGWYLPSRPDEQSGDSTSWYANMEAFVAAYANSRFGNTWQLAPDQSLVFQSGETTLSRQIQIYSPKASNDIVQLPHGCSLFLYKVKSEAISSRVIINSNGLRLLPLEECLFKLPAAFYELRPEVAQIALRRADLNTLSRLVLKEGSTTIAGRLTGALAAVGRNDDADLLAKTMTAAGHSLRITNPFVVPLHVMANARNESPYVQRIRLMWADMREQVIAIWANVPKQNPSLDIDKFMADVESRYGADALNSLSIEGYSVTPELIERVRLGLWSPEVNAADRDMLNAMAAKGYFENYKQVTTLIKQALQDKTSPGMLLKKNLALWHLALFSPSVTAGIVTAGDLAGYRNRPVFIKNAEHVPPPTEALMDAMDLLFELLATEDNAAVRAVLGHFVFVFIHPYIDGNGRLGRFILNFMLATGGHMWTVVPVAQRTHYMDALAQASSQRNIAPFALMMARLATEQANAPFSRTTQDMT